MWSHLSLKSCLMKIIKVLTMLQAKVILISFATDIKADCFFVPE